MSAISIARAIATELTHDVNSDRWTCAYEAALAAMAETRDSLRDRLASNASEEDINAHLYGTSDDWADRPRSREQARYAFADAMLAAKAMSAGTAKTEGLGGDSPASGVGAADLPETPENRSSQKDNPND